MSSAIALPLEQKETLSEMLLSGFKKAASKVGAGIQNFVTKNPILSFVALDAATTGGSLTMGIIGDVTSTVMGEVTSGIAGAAGAAADGITGAASNAFESATGAVGDFASNTVDTVKTGTENLFNNTVDNVRGLFMK